MGKLLKYCILIILVNITGIIYAQTTIPISGGDLQNENGSISYSIGQIFNHCIDCQTYSITEGIQQAYEVLIIYEIEKTNIELTVYPNPTSKILNLKVTSQNIENMSYHFFDISGKLLINKKINDYTTPIDLGNYGSSIYLLKVFQNNKKIKVLKIIKN